MTRRRAYWTCQAAGWGVYAAGNGVLGALMGRLSVWNVALDALVVALGLAVSHAIRATARSQGWLELRAGQFGARLAGASVAGAAAMVAVVVGVAYGLGLRPTDVPASPHPALAVLMLFNWTILLTVWSTVYAAVHLLWRWQAAERSRAGAEAERWRLEASVRQAELRALQAQVDPHFLFNSLNSVRALVAERPERAQQAVTELAALLRYRLTTGPTVALSGELAAVRTYLAVEEIRFEERLRWHVGAPGAAADLAVPPFVVQTLVENAVKHGVGESPTGGEVRVTVHAEPAGVRLTVENTGTLDPAPGSSVEATRLRPPRSEATAEAPVGLANARERLRLLVGDGATLRLEQASPDWVRAELFVPASVASAETARAAAGPAGSPIRDSMDHDSAGRETGRAHRAPVPL